MRARKRTAIFMKWQGELYSQEQKRRLKRFSSTRWSSQDRVLIVVQEKYFALLKTLNELTTLKDSDRDMVSTAESLLKIITSFQFVLVMHFIRKIFSITTVVSNYLQSKSMDFIQAMTLIDNAKTRLQDLRSDENFIQIVNDAKLFVHDKNLEEKDFKQTRPRKIKMMSGEKTRDEISSSPSDMFRRNVYYKVLDAIITSITVRFSD